MAIGSDYEIELEALLRQCDSSVEDLSACARNASPGMSRACRDEMEVLIANRESLRRGLLRLDDANCLCSSCDS